jgi:hypothetical protein
MIRHLRPGRYAVDQILTSSLPSESTEKRWGTIVKLDDDRIIEAPLNPMLIGDATCRPWDENGAAVWTIRIGKEEMPGRWVMVDREFRPAAPARAQT